MMPMAHNWCTCIWGVDAQLGVWQQMQPAVQLLFVSRVAKQLAENRIAKGATASFQSLRPTTFCQWFPQKRSPATKKTGEIHWLQGCLKREMSVRILRSLGLASGRSSMAELVALSRIWFCRDAFAFPESDYGDDSDSETMEHLEQFRQEQGKDNLLFVSGSGGSLCQAGQMAGYVNGVHREFVAHGIGYTSLLAGEVSTSCKAGTSGGHSFCPEIFLHVLRFLPVNEVLKNNLQAVSGNFSSSKVWMTHLFNLVDLDSFQPDSGVPANSGQWARGAPLRKGQCDPKMPPSQGQNQCLADRAAQTHSGTA
eukprot:s950_g4.t1